MDTLRDSGRAIRTTFAMFAATLTIASAAMLLANTSKAASPNQVSADASDASGGFTIKDWQLLAK